MGKGVVAVTVSVVVSLACLVSANTAWAKGSLDDHWNALGYKFDRIDKQKKLSNAHCNSSELALRSCTHAVNAILGYAPTTLRIVPEAYRASKSEYSEAKRAFGPVSIVEPPQSSAKTLPQMILESRRIKKEINDAWKALFAQVSADNSMLVEFEAIVSWLKSEPFFAQNESKIVGAVTNAFYEILHDPHTVVLPTPSMKAMFEQPEGIVGIGASMQIVEREGKQMPVIMGVIEDSPAHKGGLMPHDVVVSVDGTDVAGKPIEEVISKVRGQEGTSVTLSVLRGTETLQVSLVRAKLEQKNVKSKMLGTNKDVGYVRLDNFMEMDPHTGQPLPCDHVRDAITDLEKQGAKSLVFDLRDNGGGLIGEAECIANLFLDLKHGEPIVSTKALVAGEKSMVLPAEYPAKIHTKLPVVVLMNANSASASEIVAGALQDYERAFLIGERTYGKGSVQTFRKLGFKNELQLKETTARFYLPSGRTNQIVTVRPDIERFRVPNPTEEDKVAMREEDSYTALPPVGPDWKQTRPDTIAKLESCMNTQGTAQKEYEANLKSAIGPDFQLYSAVDAANCVVSAKLWDISVDRPTYSTPEWIVQDRAKEFFNQNVVPLIQKVF